MHVQLRRCNPVDKEPWDGAHRKFLTPTIFWRKYYYFLNASYLPLYIEAIS